MSLRDEITALAYAEGASFIAYTNLLRYDEFLYRAGKRISETGATKEDFFLSKEPSVFFADLSDARNTLPDAKSVIILGTYVYDKNCNYDATEQKLQGKTVKMVNSTSVGGGVAEMLNRVVPLFNELGIKMKWEVIKGSGDFFNATKAFHNALHGKEEDIRP